MFGFKKKTKEEKEEKRKRKEKEKQEKLSKDELSRLNQLQHMFGRRESHKSRGSDNSASPSIISTPSSSQQNLHTPDNVSHPTTTGSSRFWTSPAERSAETVDRNAKREVPDRSKGPWTPPPPKPPLSRSLPPSSGNGNGVADRSLNDTSDFTDSEQEKGGLNYRDMRPPPVDPVFVAPTRQVPLDRTPAGDFGFILRRGHLVERFIDETGAVAETKKQIIFAEPGGDNRRTGLLPGDRLVAVNDVNVEEMTRDDVIAVIRQSTNSVVLGVRPVPELAELSLRPCESAGQMMDVRDYIGQQGSLKNNFGQGQRISLASSNRNDSNHTSKSSGQAVWLVYPTGYAGARVLERSPDGARCRLRLDHDGKEIEVDAEHIELANPETLSRSENLSHLRSVNESSMVHVLRQRYGSNLFHTYAGQALLVINPMTLLSVYSDKVMQLFRGCRQEDMPPHVFATAQMALRGLQTSRQSQVICLMGRSGAGKSHADKQVITYLLHAAGQGGKMVATQQKVTIEKLQSMWSLLESFTSSRTLQNTAASRCARLTTLEMAEGSDAGRVAGVHVQVFLLEKTRIVRRPDGEPTFTVFYQMLAGLDQQKRNELHLDNLDESNLYMTHIQREDDRQVAQKAWERLVKSANMLGITDLEWASLYRLLAVIYHLGVAGAVGGGPSAQLSHCQFQKPAAAQRAASLLGYSLDQLARFVFDVDLEGAKGMGSPEHRGSSDSQTQVTPLELLEGFIMGLYTEVVQILVFLINRSLSSSHRSTQTISVLDPPGLQVPGACGRNTGASFEDLCYNYVQERLLQLAHEIHFTQQRDKYQQENIRADWFDGMDVSPADVITLLDRNSQSQHTRTAGSRDGDQKGLLWMLDEEALTGSEASFIKRVHNLYQQHRGQCKERERRVFRRVSKAGSFVLSHCLHSQQVSYNPVGWIKNCRDPPTSKNAHVMLSECRLETLNDLAVRSSEVGQTLRRGGRSTTPTPFRQKSVTAQVKFQMDFLIDLLRRSGTVRYIYCLLPVPNAGLCELRESPLAPQDGTGQAIGGGLNVGLLRQQLRGFQILQGVRVRKQGYPDQMTFHDFRRRFGVLLPPGERPESPVMDEREATETLIKKLKLDVSSYKIGVSQIFLRAGVANQLEEQKSDNVSGNIVTFQAHCRGYLARKKAQRLKVEHKAVRCIQRNSGKYLEVRNWPWWRLYVKVKPLLNVQRTEEEMKLSSEHMEAMQTRLERAEKERNQCRVECSRLEAKLSEMMSAVREEQSSVAQTGELLEVEEERRIKVERELEELKIRYQNLQRKNEDLEADLLRARTWQQQQMQASQVHGDTGDEDMEDDLYRERYRRTAQELEFLRRQTQSRQDELEEEMEKARRLAEKKLAELMEENDHLEAEATAAKRRQTKAQSELSDTRLQAEEGETRCSELERRVKRLEGDLVRLTSSHQEEAAARERLQRERDQACSDSFRSERELVDLRSELELQNEKMSRLTSQLNEVTSGGLGSTPEAEVMALRRAKMELDQKVQEAEEELDEQAATIEGLQQTKLRLEMSTEKLRQQQVKELEDRDAEVEALRASAQRRTRQLEEQMEQERDERQKLVKEKRELDRQLSALVTKQPTRDKDVERKLKKDLKTTKALLKDAHIMLEQYKNQPDEKAALKQFRDKLEESELMKEAAYRSKRSLEKDLEELQMQVDDLTRAKQEAEDKLSQATRNRSDLQSQLEDQEEELGEVMRKYKAAVAQASLDNIAVVSQARDLVDVTEERDRLRRELSETQARLQAVQGDQIDRSDWVKLETRVRELETRLELETTAKTRIQGQMDRLKEQNETLQVEKDSLSSSEAAERERTRRMQRQLREAKMEGEEAEGKLQDTERRRVEMTQRLQQLDEEHTTCQNDLKLALRRIQDLQVLIDDQLDEESDVEDADSDSDSDFDLYGNQRLLPTNHRSSQYRGSQLASSSSSVSGSHVTGYEENRRRLSGSSSASAGIDNTSEPPTY